MSVSRLPAWPDALISKPSYSCGLTMLTRMAVISAALGASDLSRCTKASSGEALGCSTQMLTPSGLFETQPERPIERARRATNGLKPTPWTMPLTCMSRASIYEVQLTVADCFLKR